MSITGAGLLERQQFSAALAVYGKASAIIEADPATLWPWRAFLYPGYGTTLFSIGRKQEAIDVFQQGLDAQSRIRTTRFARFTKALDQRESYFGLEVFKEEGLRQLLTTIVIEGMPQLSARGPLFEQNFLNGDTRIALARILYACGKREALADLYRQHITGEPASDADWGIRIAAEYRCAAVAVLLAQAGLPDVSNDAFRDAAALNFERQRAATVRSTSYLGVIGTFNAGGELLARRLGFYLANADSSRTDTRMASELAGQIIQEKGLAPRFVERENLLLATSLNANTQSIWRLRGTLEDQLAALTPSPFALKQFAGIGEKMNQGMEQVLPELQARGLGQVVTAGSTLLPQVLGALGDCAAIGYAQYTTGATTADGGALRRRYLRYCITRSTVELRDVGSKEEIDQAAYAFRRALLADRDGGTHATLLSGRLLGDLPASVSNARNWVIDPDGALSLVPFEVLSDSGGAPVLLTRSVRYVTGLAQLVSAGEEKRGGGPACIVANPAYPSATADGDASASQVSGWRLSSVGLTMGSVTVPQLPDTAAEGRAVQRSLSALNVKATLFEGADATPGALLGLTRSPVILHVASHAVLFDTHVNPSGASEAAPAGPGIDLILPGRRAGLVLSGQFRPAVMYAADIARLPLHATQLAVLSGCNTGNGDVDLGEGVSSLRRALEEAGAASTVTSLWPVPSQATTALMTAFYRGLAKGEAKGEALRQAKIELRAANIPPSGWAGFLLAGDDTPLRPA